MIKMDNSRIKEYTPFFTCPTPCSDPRDLCTTHFILCFYFIIFGKGLLILSFFLLVMFMSFD